MTASTALPPAWLVAVLLLARAIGDEHGLASASVDAIVNATGASKSQAYEVPRRLTALLPTLVRAGKTREAVGRAGAERHAGADPSTSSAAAGVDAGSPASAAGGVAAA